MIKMSDNKKTNYQYCIYAVLFLELNYNFAVLLTAFLCLSYLAWEAPPSFSQGFWSSETRFIPVWILAFEWSGSAPLHPGRPFDSLNWFSSYLALGLLSFRAGSAGARSRVVRPNFLRNTGRWAGLVGAFSFSDSPLFANTFCSCHAAPIRTNRSESWISAETASASSCRSMTERNCTWC